MLAVSAFATPVAAATVLTDISAPGSDTTFNNFNPGNTDFNSVFDAAHTITTVADFDDPADFAGMDAVWVNAHINGNFNGGVFTAAEAANVRSFIESGKKAVIITDNSNWSSFNAQIETIIGATITNTCDNSTGVASATNPLGAGVGGVNHGCGSILDPAANAEVIVSNGIASLYSVGSGEVLVITSVDLFRLSNPTEPEFLRNISAWLDEPLNVAEVPVPGGLPMLVGGVALLGLARRKRG